MLGRDEHVYPIRGQIMRVGHEGRSEDDVTICGALGMDYEIPGLCGTVVWSSD